MGEHAALWHPLAAIPYMAACGKAEPVNNNQVLFLPRIARMTSLITGLAAIASVQQGLTAPGRLPPSQCAAIPVKPLAGATSLFQGTMAFPMRIALACLQCAAFPWGAHGAVAPAQEMAAPPAMRLAQVSMTTMNYARQLQGAMCANGTASHVPMPARNALTMQAAAPA